MTGGTRRALAYAVTVLGIALPGCSVLPPPAEESQKAVIATIPADVPQGMVHTTTLLVFPPDTRPLYDTTQMAYTAKPYQVDYFSRHEWGETPSQMLLPLLVKTLENTHSFSAVLTPPWRGPYSYALRTEILELTQDFTENRATLILSLRLLLSEGATGKIIATRNVSVREPMQAKTPEAGVDAANRAAATALQQTARFVLEETQ